MKRLTGRRDERTYIIGCLDFVLPKIAELIIQQTVDRLAAIEDILGDEYEPDRLRELVGADREGRCLVLEDLTISDLQQMLIVLDSTCYGDGAETYTAGYRNGHRNGRIEILRSVLEIPEGDSSDTESGLKAREQDEKRGGSE